jgi:hypothetical protein
VREKTGENRRSYAENRRNQVEVGRQRWIKKIWRDFFEKKISAKFSVGEVFS